MTGRSIRDVTALSGDRQSRAALADLIAAFSEPGAVDPAFAAHIVEQASRLLDEAEARDPGRPRMPTRLFPLSAVIDVPDEPPVPPGAL